MSPRFWRTLLAFVIPPADRTEVLGELDDEFAARAAADGLESARSWYRRQARRSVAPLLRRRLAVVLARWRPSRGQRRRQAMTQAGDDVVFLWRRARRRPLLPSVVVLTIAIAVGAVTSVFSIADTLLVRPLPLPDSGRIVRFHSQIRNFGSSGSVNYFDVRDIGESSRTLAAVSVFQSDAATWRRPAGPEPLALALTGPGFQQVLGLRVALGRGFDEAEYAYGAPPVAIATNQFWVRALGGTDSAIGSTLDLDGRVVRIVGVLEASEFLFPSGADLWMPFVIAPDSFLNNRQSVSLGALGRVRADATMEAASAEVASLVAGLQAQYPDTSGRRGLELRGLAGTLGAPVRETLMLLATIVLAVLLIAATNVTDLLLSDAGARAHEFAIRASLGGGARRLAGQVMAESASLALLGGIGGLVCAPWLIATLVSLYPTTLPRAAEIGLGPRGIAVAVLATVLTGLLMAIPLVRATRRGIARSGLVHGDRATAGRSERRLTRTLVVAQMALSVVLLFAGGLLTRAFLRAASTDIGFEPGGTLTFNIAPASSRYSTTEAQQAFADRLLSELRPLAGVREVALTRYLPFTPGMWGDSFSRVGTADRAPDLPEANMQFVSDGFPGALGLRVTAGREFTAADRLGAPRVAMVNDALARRFFDGAAVGRRVVFSEETWEIVGVLSDKRHASLGEPPSPELYMPWNQSGRIGGWVIIRTDGVPLSLLSGVKAAMGRVDPTIALTRIGTMDDRLTNAMAPERFRATLASALGAVALTLVVIGLYGVMAHTVARRTREFGVRLALGESPSRVSRQILRGALALALAGIVPGVGLSWLAAPRLQSFLSGGLQAFDPWLLATLVVLLLAVAVASAVVPARRASRIDPLSALREL